MTTQLQTALDTFIAKMNLLKAMSSAQALLSWDRETYMPKKASPDRGETTSLLAGLSHELFVDTEFVKTVQELFDQAENLTPQWKRSVTLTHRDLQKSLKLSKKFVEDTNQMINASQAAWLEARQQKDFQIFRPHLEKVVENRKQYAAFLDPNKDPYDVNLDDYEENLTSAFLLPLFQNLRAGLKELLPKITAKQQKVANPLNDIQLNQEEMKAFLNEMMMAVGFDLDRGVLAAVEHPFETTISQNDVRVNTRFKTNEHSFTIMGLIHEMGHGLYEQNIDPQYVPYYLDHGVSLGIHESQSRFLENMVGRSDAFWAFFLPKLQAHFPQLKSVTLEQLLAALNLVQPSLIRTEADEVTYNLHIILRFEIEYGLLHGEMQVKDLPEIWRAKMKELIGVEPTNDHDGVLQDVHWSWANIGYFPTYSLGNLNAAQLFFAFTKAHPDWQAQIATGGFANYMQWFKEHIWQYGAMFTPDELMLEATGEKTNAMYLLKYLEEKYVGGGISTSPMPSPAA